MILKRIICCLMLHFRICILSYVLGYEEKCLAFRSHNHELYSQKVCKAGLSPFDDKRFVLDNGYDTLAHGHYRAEQAISEREAEDDEVINILNELMNEN